jgi:hypothetical protein
MKRKIIIPESARGVTGDIKEDGSLDRVILRENVCEQYHSHEHDTDHLFSCLTGAAELHLTVDGIETVLIKKPGDEAINVPARAIHHWKALEKNTSVCCAFPSGTFKYFGDK